MVKSKSPKTKRIVGDSSESPLKCKANDTPVASPMSTTGVEVPTQSSSYSDLATDVSYETSIEFSVHSEGRSSRSMADTVTQLQSVIAGLERDKVVLELQLSEKDSLLSQSNSEIDHLHNGLKSLQYQFVQMEKENKKARQTLLEMSENYQSIDEYQKQIVELTEEVNKLNGIVEQLENDKEQLEFEHKVSLESSVNDLELFRTELSDTIAELNASYAQLAKVESDHQKDIVSLRKELSEDSSVAAHQREQSHLNEIEALHKRCNDGESLLEDLRNQLETLRAQQQETKDKQCEVDRLMAERTALVQEINTLSSRNSALEAKQAELVSTFRLQLMELQSEAKNMCDEKNALQAELTKCKAELSGVSEQLKSKLSTLEKARKAYKTLTAEKDRLSGELDAAQTATHDRVAELQALKTELDLVVQARADDTQVWSNRVVEAQGAMAQMEVVHSNKVTQLSESLKFATDDLCSTTNDLTSANIELNEMRVEVDLLRLQSREAQHCSNTLQLEIERLRSELDQSSYMLMQVQKDLENSLLEAEKLREERNKLVSENEEQLSAMKSQLLQLIDSQSLMQRGSTDAVESLASLERRYSDAVEDLDRSKLALKECEDNAKVQAADAEKVRHDLQVCQAAMEELKASHTSLKKKAVQLKGLYQQCTQDLKEAKAHAESTACRESSLLKQLTDLQQNFDELQQQYDTLQHENKAKDLLEQRNVALQESYDLLDRSHSELSKSFQAQSIELSEALLTIKQLETTSEDMIHAHQVEVNDLNCIHQSSMEAVNGKLRAAGDLIGILQEEVSGLSFSLSENRSMADELLTVKGQIQQLQSDNEQLVLQSTHSSTANQAYLNCQSELEAVRQELMASLLDMSAFTHGLTQAHGQLIVLKNLVNLRLEES